MQHLTFQELLDLKSLYAFFKRTQNVVITVPADVLAPNGAKTSAGTVLTT